MRRASLALVSLATCGLLWAKDFWKEKPFQEWTREECFRIFQDSPWVRLETRSIINPSGAGISNPGVGPSGNRRGSVTGEERVGDFAVSRQYYVRLQSAKPVRMALARLQLIAGKVTEESAHRYIETAPGQGKIVIMISVPPGQDRTEFDGLNTQQISRHTYLVGKKSKKKVFVERYFPPAEVGGIEPVLVFPRLDSAGDELFPIQEKEMRFVSDIGGRINVKFKLKHMVFDGKLEF